MQGETKENERYALLGGGGLALELFEYMERDGNKPIGYYAPQANPKLSKYIQWLGDERDGNLDASISYIIASGYLDIRSKMIQFIEEKQLCVGSYVSKKAYVSSKAVYGKGVVITPFSMITGNALLGDYVLVNMQAVIAHDAVLGKNVVVGPGTQITGHCEVGDCVVFGANSALLPGTKLGAHTEIGICTFPNQQVGEHKLVVNKPGNIMFNFKEISTKLDF